MMLQIKRWLTPPVFPNDETRTRRAIVLNTTLLTSSALALALVAGNLAGGNVPPAVNAVDIVGFALCLALRRWTYQGRIGLAGGVLLAVGLVGITLAIALLGTMRVPTAGVYMLLVIAAGLLFDLSGMIAMTVLCALAVAGLIVAENSGWLPRPNYAVTLTQWIAYTVLFAWAGSLTLSSLQSMRQALTRANREIAERKQAESQREAALAALQQAHAELEQRVAERTEELQANRRQLADIIEFLPDATLAIDQDKRVILWNKAIEDMTGVPAAEMIGHGGYAYAIPFYGEARPQLIDLIFEDQAEVAARYPAITREGDTLSAEVFCHALYHDQGAWVMAKASPLHDQAGNIIGALESIRDITESKRAESQREAALEALRESQSLYHSLVEVSPLSICRKDLAGRFTFANRRFLEASNRSLADLVGQTDFDLHPPELAEKYRSDDRAVMDSGQVWELVEPRAIQGNEAIEEALVVQTIKAPVYDGAGKINGVQISFWDITDRQRAEEALRKSHAELQTRNEELDAFAHTVAHDLKDPLGVIMGYAGLLADHGALPTDIVQQALIDISRSGRKAANIIESLLMLASVRKQDVRAAPLDMARIVDEVLLRLADSIQDSGAEICVPDRASWPVALGHAPWIEEIWVNYLSNALKYGGPRPRIDLGAARLPPLSATGEGQGGGFIRFSVRDYGPGLTPEQQERLFAPFERLGQAHVTGYGLGLSVARRIAEKLGGQVGVDSQPGTLRGSTFYFTLPAAPDFEGFGKS